ncbi:MAG: MarR family transcriptional regulator [Candidatus Izemoplasma sp.]|nr:MarR family transcriptional regulator [Candidatus Izemoplasma sp.]
MEEKYDFYFEFIEDILNDLKHYEENALHILTKENVSLNEARILYVIDDLKQENNNLSSQIAMRMDTTRSAVSIALKALEKKQLIFRATDPNDRRCVYVELTKRGSDVLAHYTKVHNETMQKAFDVFDDEDEKTLTLLTTILRNQMKSLVE